MRNTDLHWCSNITSQYFGISFQHFVCMHYWLHVFLPVSSSFFQFLPEETGRNTLFPVPGRNLFFPGVFKPWLKMLNLQKIAWAIKTKEEAYTCSGCWICHLWQCSECFWAYYTKVRLIWLYSNLFHFFFYYMRIIGGEVRHFFNKFQFLISHNFFSASSSRPTAKIKPLLCSLKKELSKKYILLLLGRVYTCVICNVSAQRHTVLSLINALGALQFFKRGMFIRGKFSMQKGSV